MDTPTTTTTTTKCLNKNESINVGLIENEITCRIRLETITHINTHIIMLTRREQANTHIHTY